MVVDTLKLAADFYLCVVSKLRVEVVSEEIRSCEVEGKSRTVLENSRRFHSFHLVVQVILLHHFLEIGVEKPGKGRKALPCIR